MVNCAVDRLDHATGLDRDELALRAGQGGRAGQAIAELDDRARDLLAIGAVPVEQKVGS